MTKREAGAHFEVLARAGRSLLEGQDLDQQLSTTLRLATESVGADRGSVLMADPAERVLRIKVSTGLPPEAEKEVVPFGEGIAGWVALNNEAVVLHGGFSDSRFKGKDPTIESSISLPLAVDGTVLGVLNIVRRSGDRFTTEDLALAEALADFAALALEKARLYQILKDRESRVSALLRFAIQAQEQERRRVAADVHDGFLQDLSAVFLKAENAKMQLARHNPDAAMSAISDIQEMIRDEVKAVRDFIFEVRPPSLDQIGLGPTIRAMVDQVSGLQSINGVFDQLGQARRLPEAIEAIVYRTAQEAIRNISKHAGARSFRVTLEQTDTEVVLVVADDGKGIDETSPRQTPTRHFGIETMRERVELAGGRFQIGTGQSGGTEVRAMIPVDSMS